MLDFETAFRFVGALAFVVGLIALISYAARRYRGLPAGKRTNHRRMSVVEAVGVDAKRRLILVQADQREYLLLVGGTTDLLVDTREVSAAVSASMSKDTLDG